MTEKQLSTEIAKIEPQIECENCHAFINGKFCSQCGQSQDSSIRYFWSVILHLLHDIFSFDSRASRTLKPLIFKPGFLTKEYFCGRRVHYVPPLRLYLFISIIFFISLKFFTFTDTSLLVRDSRINNTIEQIDTAVKELEVSLSQLPITEQQARKSLIERMKQYQQDLSTKDDSGIVELTEQAYNIELESTENGGELSASSQKKLEKLQQSIQAIKSGEKSAINKRYLHISNNADGSFSLDFLSEENNKRLAKKLKGLEEKAQKAFTSDARPLVQESISKLPQLMFILLPLFAVILKLFYLFSKRLYMEHLTVALHSHSFIFIIFLIINLLSSLQRYLAPDMPSFAEHIDDFSLILLVWLPCYLFMMQKRVYQQGYFFTFVKFIFIAIIYAQLIALTTAIAFIWGLADV